jgi:hypothetical protein
VAINNNCGLIRMESISPGKNCFQTPETVSELDLGFEVKRECLQDISKFHGQF